MSDVKRSYELAGRLCPSGWTKFADNEVRSVGGWYGDVRVTLKSGEVLIVKGIYREQLERLVR